MVASWLVGGLADLVLLRGCTARLIKSLREFLGRTLWVARCCQPSYCLRQFTRTRLILQRFSALTAGACGISAAVWIAMPAIQESADLTSISPTEFLAQCLNLALLAVAFGALAMGLGAATGRRAIVVAATAGIGVLTYAAHTFADRLGADWAAYLSPFHYYIGGEPLKHGIQWADSPKAIAEVTSLLAPGDSGR